MRQKQVGNDSAKSTLITRVLLICGVIAGPFFSVMWLIEGATRANYNPLRHPISSLSLGDFGWMQMVNFIVTGLLMLAFAIGLWRAIRSRGCSIWGPLLMGAMAIGFLGAGFFATDPISGYPPGTPDKHSAYSGTPAALHDLFSAFVFLGLPVVCFVLARWFTRWKKSGWAIYSRVTGLAFVGMFFVTSAGFAQTKGLVDFGGLFQRITLIIGWTWLTLLALYLLKTPSEIPGTESVTKR